MDEEVRRELSNQVNKNKLSEHKPEIEKAMSNIGIIPGKEDIKKIIEIVNNQIKEKNIKSFTEAFNKHPRIIEILNNEIKENEEIKTDSLTKKIKKQFNEKDVKGILKILGKIQKNNEIVLTGKLREHFNDEMKRWEG